MRAVMFHGTGKLEVVDRPSQPLAADERVGIVKAEQPMAGLAWLATGGGTEDQSHAMIHINFFGPDADALADREQAIWQDWLQRTFPMAAPAPTPA